MSIKNIVKLYIITFWPLAFFLTNTSSQLITFAIPGILLLVSLILFKRKSRHYLLPLILIPFVAPKLSLFPLLFLGLIFIHKRNLINFGYIVLTILIFIFSFTKFTGQTIFVSDYEAKQAVIRKQQLYPNPFLARVFHNKARIVFEKANNNFFELTDPSNYLFGFAPRQVIERNQNIDKYPFLSLPFLLLGFYSIKRIKNKEFVLISLISSILSLVPLTLYDKNDFILYIPVTLIILNGLNFFDKSMINFKKVYYLLFIFISSIELVRLIVQFH